MKISKSKQELARIINENGGWRGWTEWSVQNGDHGRISFSENKPERHRAKSWVARGGFQFKIEVYKPIRNWHQCILSREEYFHLYPEPDAKPKFCESVMRSTPETKPTIEQLAADYRAKLDVATSAQEEADANRCGAEAALGKLEIALKDLGFKIEPITAKQEPELVIIDWRDLMVGDEIECVEYESEYRFGVVSSIDESGGNQCVEVYHANTGDTSWPSKWRFIRRP